MSKLKSQIESLLFINNQPFSLRQLVNLTKADSKQVDQAVTELFNEYHDANKGIIVQKLEDKVQMVTAPDNAKIVNDFVKEEVSGDLTRAALETLTIVAYRGPINRAELEQIRGVNCSIILRNLMIRGLVEATEDKKKMQTSYNVTLEFLQFLGLHEQSELPDFAKLNSSASIDKVLHPQEKNQSTPTE